MATLLMNGCSTPSREIGEKKSQVSTGPSGDTLKELIDSYFHALGYTKSVSQELSFDRDFQPAIDWARKSGDNKLAGQVLDNLGFEVLAIKDWLKNKSGNTDKLGSLYVFLTSLRVIVNAISTDGSRRSVLMEDASKLLAKVQRAKSIGITGREGAIKACKRIMAEPTDCEIFSIKVFITIPGLIVMCKRNPAELGQCDKYINKIKFHYLDQASDAYVRTLRPDYDKYANAIDMWWNSDANEIQIFDLLLSGNSMPDYETMKHRDLKQLAPASTESDQTLDRPSQSAGDN